MRLPQGQVSEFLSTWYKDTRWSLSSADIALYRERAGTLTYGEITESSIEKLLEWLDIGESDVVYDLGCGLGKFVAQAYLRTGAKAVYGVELTESRFNQAQEMLQKIRNVPDIHTDRSIDIYQGDISEAQCADATVVYMCSTCYPAELLNQIVDNLSQHSALGLRLISLKRLPVPKCFHLIEKRELPMTWSNNSPVYLYELKESAATSEVELPAVNIDTSDWDSDDWDSDDWGSDDWDSE